jgi:hypothetical protein
MFVLPSPALCHRGAGGLRMPACWQYVGKDAMKEAEQYAAAAALSA